MQCDVVKREGLGRTAPRKKKGAKPCFLELHHGSLAGAELTPGSLFSSFYHPNCLCYEI